MTWGTVPRSAFNIIQGNLRRIPFAGRIRGFAECCCTHVLFEDSSASGTVDVAIATLDDPGPFRPSKAIWIEDKLPWVVLDPGLPAYPRNSGASV